MKSNLVFLAFLMVAFVSGMAKVPRRVLPGHLWRDPHHCLHRSFFIRATVAASYYYGVFDSPRGGESLY